MINKTKKHQPFLTWASLLWALALTVLPITEAMSTSQNGAADLVKLGQRNFTRPIATGNKRSCATCHVPEDGFTLTPEHVEKLYQKYASRPRVNGRIDFQGDPLFNPIDADDYDQDFTSLRKGLVRVKIPLGELMGYSIEVLELPSPPSQPSKTEIGLFRSVPTIWNTAFTAPYQLDERAATLQEQARGAALSHLEVKTLPSAAFFDAIAAYEQEQYSSARVRPIADLLAAGVSRQDPGHRADRPHLDAEEKAGRDAFDFRCMPCHGGPTLNAPVFFGVDFANTTADVSFFNKANLPVYTFRETCVTPDPVTQTCMFGEPKGYVWPDYQSPDLGAELISIAGYDKFDTPTLYGISKTAPYFHDNSAKTLEDVMQQYQDFFRDFRSFGNTDSFLLTDMTKDEIRLIIKYLKTL